MVVERIRVKRDLKKNRYVKNTMQPQIRRE